MCVHCTCTYTSCEGENCEFVFLWPASSVDRVGNPEAETSDRYVFTRWSLPVTEMHYPGYFCPVNILFHRFENRVTPSFWTIRRVRQLPVYTGYRVDEHKTIITYDERSFEMNVLHAHIHRHLIDAKRVLKSRLSNINRL